MELKNTNDWELIAEQLDRKKAFEELFIRHRDCVFRLALSLSGRRWIAEDVLQEVFIRLFLKSFVNNPELKFTNVIYEITLKVTQEELRGYQTKKEAMSLHHLWHSNDTQREAIINDFQENTKRLTQLQREVFTLKSLEGIKAEKVAQIMGCTEEAVMKNLNSAFKNLIKGENIKDVDEIIIQIKERYQGIYSNSKLEWDRLEKYQELRKTRRDIVKSLKTVVWLFIALFMIAVLASVYLIYDFYSKNKTEINNYIQSKEKEMDPNTDVESNLNSSPVRNKKKINLGGDDESN